MKKLDINLNLFRMNRGVACGNSEKGNVYICPKEGLELVSVNKPGEPIQGIAWQGMKYLVVELETLEEHSLTFNVDLYRQANQEEYDMRITFSVLPHVMTVVPIDLKYLDSQVLFPPRTAGRLRMIIYGKPITIDEISCIKLTTLKCYKDQKICIKSIYLTDEAPVFHLPDIKLMDELGQWIPKDWDTKVCDRDKENTVLRNLLKEAEACEYKYENEEWNRFGGWKKKKFEKTGWFHTVFDGNRWWLADPEGNAFFSTGIDCITPGSDSRVDVMRSLCKWIPERDREFKDAWNVDKDMEIVNYGIVNLVAAFGVDKWWESWAKIIKMYLYRWHINTVANWSSPEFIKWVQMPYVLPLDNFSERGFPATKVNLFRDFPDVFSDEYGIEAVRFAEALKQFRDDEYMIGYFMRNEPNWGFVHGLNIAEEMLANPAKTKSKEEFINRLRSKYTDIGQFNRAWNLDLSDFEDLYMLLKNSSRLSEEAYEDLKEFSSELINRYVEIPARACRAVDKNHLNLGMRYAYITDPIMLSGYKNFDVFSINSYQFNPLEHISGIGKLLDMPVMLGEFHFGALDKGLTSHGLRGVENQKERGVAYRYYVENGIRSPYFLGAHYFMLNDQSCIGRFDGENYQIGLLDVCMQEYRDMTSGITECNRNIYRVLSGEIAPYDTPAKQVHAVHC